MSQVCSNYKNYRKHLPEYESWRENQELQAEKRIEYLKRNPDKINKEDIKRAEILMHAIDVMDEYSQSNAEDMEVVTEMASNQIVQFVSTIGAVGGLLLTQIPAIKKGLTKFMGVGPKAGILVQIIPTIVGTLLGFAASFPVINWATKLQISSSRKGRFEAMRTDLKNPALFAVLTKEQQQKAEKNAENIVIEDHEKKRIEKAKNFDLNPLESFKTLKKMYKEDTTYKEQKADFDKTLKENEKYFNSTVTEEQVKHAKRDQQLLFDLVRKMDIASQDYAENTELATNTLTTLAFAGGGLIGWASNKLMNLAKINPANKLAKVIPWAVGLTLPLLMSIYSAKVQKRASRIGRFNVRNEMLNNPASLVYVDAKNTVNIEKVKVPTKQKKNIFKFFKQLYKDNKAYDAYLKNERIKDLKFSKAVENLDLTEEQLQDAKALQMNVFKTFNKVDEKSQTYAESVEALGQIVQQGFAGFGSLALTIVMLMRAFTMFDKAGTSNPPIAKMGLKIFGPLVAFILPVIGLEVYTTKEQKKASRVADMLALKDLEDYRHFVDYSKKQSVNKVQETEESNLLKRLKM